MAQNRKSVLILSILFAAFSVLLPLLSGAELREYIVAGQSMSPALVPGDKVVVDTDVKGQFQRGDIVSIVFNNSSNPLVKRIAAVPGDRVEFLDDTVLVNGRKVREIYMRRWRSTIKQIERFENTVPAGYYLILGDNPVNSRDSGRLGLISQRHLMGKVVKMLKKGTTSFPISLKASQSSSR